jgi:hypothetical protein
LKQCENDDLHRPPHGLPKATAIRRPSARIMYLPVRGIAALHTENRIVGSKRIAALAKPGLRAGKYGPDVPNNSTGNQRDQPAHGR